MPDVKFTCISCRTPLSASPEEVGELMQCPSCQQTMVVPPYGVIPGMRLGDFTIEKCLGIGGMGEVWLANQESLHRKVALKVLSPEIASDNNFVRRFLQEVKIAGKLTHPNIVMAYQAGEQHGIRYLAISYVDGKVLGENISESNPMPEHKALRVIREIARALKYAWDKFQILHRDIKPDNIMIAVDGTPMLMDMGISKITSENESLTMTGTIIGTPNYISPEQARAQSDLDFRTDQYSLGATLYHLVTGQLPYTATSAMGILAQHLQEPVPDCRKVNPAVSEGCQALIKIMMAKKKEDRFVSWDEVIAAVDRLLPSGMREITPAPNSIPAVPANKKSNRNKYLIAALIVFLLLAVISLKNQLKQTRRENKDLMDMQKFMDELEKPLVTDEPEMKKIPEPAANNSDQTRKKQPEFKPTVIQLKSPEDDEEKATPAKPDKSKDAFKDGDKKKFKHEADIQDEKIKSRLKEILDIDDATAEHLTRLVKYYRKEAFQIIIKKVPDTPEAKLRKVGELKQLQIKVIEKAGTMLTQKQKETFVDFINHTPQKPHKRRFEEMRNRSGQIR